MSTIGSPFGVLYDDARRVLLGDGTIGYYSRRDGDCWLAAVATCLQVPIGLVPDAHPLINAGLRAGMAPDEINRWAQQQMEAWLRRLGLQRVRHATVPAPERRWIGVIPDGSVKFRHCLVMCEGELLFDPSPEVSRVLEVSPADIGHGFSFQSVEGE